MTEILVPIDDINEYIETHKFKYRKGMERPDASIIERLGRKRWEETQQAHQNTEEKKV